MVESCGPVTCYPQKTRIVFQERIRFGTCQTRKNFLRCGLLLSQKYPEDKNLLKIETYSDSCHGHYFKMQHPDDFDEDFMALIKEAYQVGQQKLSREIDNKFP